MTADSFNFNSVHPSWLPCLQIALKKMEPAYLDTLLKTQDWLPSSDTIFNAFSLPVDKVKYILFGESPYPRKQSANGYAFWDASVKSLWSETGLSKEVNRATSMRNIMKMLLVAENLLSPDNTSQTEIAKINKSSLIKSNDEFFQNLLQHGFLLLNATLVLRPDTVKKDALAWHPFICEVVNHLLQQHKRLHLILLGNIANTIDKIIDQPSGLQKLYAEHPYNLSFIANPTVIDFFRPFHLLRCKH